MLKVMVQERFLRSRKGLTESVVAVPGEIFCVELWTYGQAFDFKKVAEMSSAANQRIFGDRR